MKRRSAALVLLAALACAGGLRAGADSFTDELQWLAKYTACLGQYNMAQTGDYVLGDPHDYYKPQDIREYLARQSGDRTSTATFYGICFDYARAAYNEISGSRSRYESLGMESGGWYIAAAHGRADQIVLYDPVPQGQHTLILNGIPVKEISRQNARSHEGAVNHAWLWVYGKDGTVYWLDPTWTDNTGYVWWGVVRNGREEQFAPAAQYCMVQVNPAGAGFADFNRGNASKNRSDYDRAIAEYNEALRKDPGNAEAYYNRGMAYFNRKMYDQAIADYTAALRYNSGYAEAYASRGATYGYKGLWDQEIADSNAAIRLNPNLAEAYNNRGVAYRNKKMIDLALADYNTATRLNPNLAVAYNNRGFIYNAKGLYDRAMTELNTAIRLDPNYSDAYNNRGFAYDKKRMYNRAIEEFNAALRCDSTNAEAYNNRGVTYYNKGMYDQAIADFNAALRFNPSHPTARQSLYYTRRARGY